MLDFDKSIDAIVCSEENEYIRSDKVDMSGVNEIEVDNMLTPKFLNTLSTSSLPNHKIKLKFGLK
ncbi:hypothetical protein Lal_00041318 [Lupinus albus]|nr:hypothetical protein Lal_00041318 [Lupinus albus]